MNPHARHPATPLEMFRSFWNNRCLIWQMTRREVIGRYRGSMIGVTWSFLHPLLMLSIYTFVFSAIFKARWGLGEDEDRINFAIILFVGLIVHGIFAECANRAPSLIISNVSYVKKVVFPLEILPWVAMGSTLFHSLVSLLVLMGAIIIFGPGLHWSILLLPFILLPLIIVTMGIGWFLTAIGVYIRDIGQTISIITTMLLFLSPIFFPISALPTEFQQWMLLNPLTLIIEESRTVLIWGHMPNWRGLAIYGVCSIIVSWLGFWWFQRTRNGFADVV